MLTTRLWGRELHMSLDKFVLRGFTASTGGGADGWVAKTSQPYTQQTVKESHNSGTSFVMGRGRPQSSSNQHSKEAMASHREEVRTHGTRGSGTLPKQCFGSSGSSQSSSIPYSGTVIPAMFFLMAIIVIVYLAAGSSAANSRLHSSDSRMTTDADVYRRFQPNWSR